MHYLNCCLLLKKKQQMFIALPDSKSNILFHSQQAPKKPTNNKNKNSKGQEKDYKIIIVQDYLKH